MTTQLSHKEAAVLKELYNAFRGFPKPKPLVSYTNSQCHEQVNVFNDIDWEAVTFRNFMDGYDGWIISGPSTVVYLLPRLFRMIFQEHSQTEAIHNVTEDVFFRLTDGYQREEISASLNSEQKNAVVAAFQFMDCEYFGDPVGASAARVASAFGI